MSARTLLVSLVLCCVLATLDGHGQSQPEFGVSCLDHAGTVPLRPGVQTSYTEDCTIGPTGTDVDLFSFSGQIGETVRVTVSSTSLTDPLVTLKDPASAVLDEQACSRGPCTVDVNAVLATSGVFTVQVADELANDAGGYVLQLEILPPAYCPPMADPGAGVADRIEPITDLDTFRFQGRDGESVTVDVSSAGAMDPRVRVIDPEGATIAEAECSGPCTASVSPALSLDGTYRILVSDFEADEQGDYTVTLTCDAGSCLGNTALGALDFPDKTTISWAAVADATANYDVVRGDLGSMRAGGSVEAGSPECLSLAGMGVSIVDGTEPGIGEGLFYLSRALGGDGLVGDYDAAWGPGQNCGRTTTVCDVELLPGYTCEDPIVTTGIGYMDSNTNCGAPAEILDYGNPPLCNPTPSYKGPELIYRVELASATAFTARLTPAGEVDLALFLVSDCADPTTCVLWGDAIGAGLPDVAATEPGAPLGAGTYYLYVDSYYGTANPMSCGDFTLELTDVPPAVQLLDFQIE